MDKKEAGELLDLSLLVDEHASVSVRAELFLVELLAHLGLVLRARRLFFAHEILPAVGELAFASVPAETLLDPVLAHFGLVLGSVDAALDGGQGGGLSEIGRLIGGGEGVGGFS